MMDLRLVHSADLFKCVLFYCSSCFVIVGFCAELFQAGLRNKRLIEFTWSWSREICSRLKIILVDLTMRSEFC